MLLQLSVQLIDLFQYRALEDKLRLSVYVSSFVATPPSPSSTGWDPTVIAAVISAGASVVAALIAIGIAIYQTQQSRKIEREKDEQQRHHEQEMERYRRELDMQYREKELEKQLADAVRLEMLTAQNTAARAATYRKALHVDPYLSRIQILDMQHPLEVTNIYVRVRVHEDTIVRYALDPALATAAEQRDPNSFFQARHHYLEQRVGTAIDPDVAIRKYRRCVIVGDPGAGKTTLLKYLVLTLADGKYPNLPDLPIHIELSAFVSSEEQDILDYGARRWEERYAFPQTEARNYMDATLRDGQVILLLDALDETVVGEQPGLADASYQKAWDAIMHLATRYPEAYIVVAARKAGYQQHRPLHGFTIVEVMDFRRADIRQFVDNWFRRTQGSMQVGSADDLIERLDRNPRIQALAANPLLLSLIVLVYEAQLDLPDRRAELYRECIDVLLAKWDAKRNIRRRRIFKPDQKRRLLAEVAWYFHQQGRRYFPEQELLAEIAHFLPALGLPAENNQQVLQEITNENGLLKEQAHGWYGFLHLTLQEYLAATAINDQGRLTTLVSQCADPWWEEVLLLHAGQTSDASPLLLHLLGKDCTNPQKDDLFYTKLLMAGRCLASSPTIRQKDLREEVIERIFTLFLQSHYHHLREQIGDVFVMIGGNVVTSRLVTLLKDIQITDWHRDAIARALRRLRKGSIAQDLVEILKDNQIAESRRGRIALALGQLGERSITQDLVVMLKERRLTKELRSPIALALLLLGDKSVAQDLIEILKDSPTADEVSSNIASALGHLGNRSMVPDLVRMLKDRSIADGIRREIAVALGRLGDQSVVPDLIGMLKDNQNDNVGHWEIVWALGWLGDRSVVSDLLEMIQDSRNDSVVRGKMVWALGRLGVKSIVPDLTKMLQDSRTDSIVRGNIAVALGRLGVRTAVPDLMGMLKENRVADGIRDDIAWVLGGLGERAIVPDLVELLKKSETASRVRCSIAETLGKLAQDEQTMKTCVLLLSQTPTDVADAIYGALWNMSHRAEVTIVVQDDGSGETVEFVPWQGRMKG